MASLDDSPAARWALDEAQQGLSSLHFEPDSSTTGHDLGPEDVLVRIHAASLNYRDLAIARGGAPGAVPLPASPNVIPGSDGAGTVLAVGSAVDWLQPGDQVVTHMVARKPDDHMPTVVEDIGPGLGGILNGTLCQRGVFHHSCLVSMPKNMSFEEAATLTCSGLTAWNALMGLPSMQVAKGDWILVQGTGGVSVAALQIAVAVGANVIAITSSASRAQKLEALGAKHVINYREQTNWGEIAKSLTPDKRGVDHVVDVVGAKSLAQSLQAVRPHGLITIAGIVGGMDETDPGIMSSLWKPCMFRGILLGSRRMFMDMVRFMEENDVRPAVDDVSFRLEDAKAAYERLEQQEHFSKVIIKVN
ncbi:unnamed protein product [Discula destructiva]